MADTPFPAFGGEFDVLTSSLFSGFFFSHIPYFGEEYRGLH